MAQIDAGEFRAGQRQQWDIAATGWKKWSELIDRGAAPISERRVELAGVEPGVELVQHLLRSAFVAVDVDADQHRPVHQVRIHSSTTPSGSQRLMNPK